MGLLHDLISGSMPFVPTPVMRKLAGRYIAGETLDQALARLSQLSARGFPGILDILGEAVENEAEARAAAKSYMDAASALATSGLDAYVSIKPTHFALQLSEELCLELYREVAKHLEPLGIFLRVEMEDHPTIDGTLRVFEVLRGEFEHVGIVLQSRLFRTPEDIDRLAPGPLQVRMVKGIYLEPAEIAHTDYAPIADAYLACAQQLWKRGANLSLATHDEVLAARLLEHAEQEGYGADRFEFEVLLGVRQRLWDQWRTAGHIVRVYVPYGPDWRAYSQRRLRKNPQILRHVMGDMFGLNR